ncbi:MAG TPA: PilZ domain-containing protein [Candidatus Acidoferrales bacterium]|nr:PilZ domain-containing protein [Candidatus Acidoferrales bacterium]
MRAREEFFHIASVQVTFTRRLRRAALDAPGRAMYSCCRPMATTSSGGGSSGGRRRSQRVLVQVGVTVSSASGQNRRFEEETETLAINAHGALVRLAAPVTAGQKVMLKHNKTQEEQECSVVFLGPQKGNKAEVGLEFCAPCPAFWRVAFPPEDWTPRHPEARRIH